MKNQVKGEKKAPKSANERANDTYQRKISRGEKRMWVDAETQRIAKELGGFKELAAEFRRLQSDQEKMAQRIAELEAGGLKTKLFGARPRPVTSDQV